MKRILLLSIFAVTIFSNCKKTETEQLIVKMYFHETRCANPWETRPNSENYLDEVKNYLKEKKIPVESITVRQISEPPIYGGCNVRSGRKIYIEVFEKYEASAAALGFITYN
uniref:hypothetical protein n=1 Tax=uncultured Draconibacterium sp. TaxID=1573823 RepID=UPI003216C797